MSSPLFLSLKLPLYLINLPKIEILIPVEISGSVNFW